MKLDRPLLRASWHGWIAGDLRPAGPRWLQWLWVLLFALAMAVVFTVMGFVLSRSGGGWLTWLGWFGKNLVVCLLIVALIQGLHEAVRWRIGDPSKLKHWPVWQRTLVFTGIPILGVVIGWPLGVMLVGMDLAEWLARPEGLRMVGTSIGLAVIVTLILHHLLAARARLIDSERRTTEAQLRLLQAQMEPHFLFNTLANVQSLMDHDPPKARRMLSSFTDYLRASLTTLRGDSSTVAQELVLAENYLLLLQGRMEDRLAFAISADDAARAQPLPPLLLQPLVENAVVHGLEPSIEGGRVQVTARVNATQLVLEVRDDGRGPDAAPRRAPAAGNGLALANIRQRLLARYGAAATLEVLPGHPGTLARLTLPLQGTRP